MINSLLVITNKYKLYILFIGYLNNIFKNQHIVTQQLINNLRPTRNLKAKYLLLSKKIKQTTDHYAAGIISTWKFMQIVSYSSTDYLQRQINFINEVDDDEPEFEIDVLHENDEIIEQINQNITSEQNQSTCMVCMINTVANCQPHIIIPCGHAWICEVCVNSLLHQNCPLCRLEDVTFQRIYFN